MAWYNGGTWDGVPVEKLGHILSDLCIAVNERENLIFGAKTSWTLPGTADPAPADFEDIPIWTIENTFPNGIVTELHTAINALVSATTYRYDGADKIWQIHWATSDTVRTVRTIAQILAAGSYGGTWLPAARAQSAPLFLQILEVLDALKWPRIAFTISSPTGDYHGSHSTRSDTAATWEGAWDDAKGEAYVELSAVAQKTFIREMFVAGPAYQADVEGKITHAIGEAYFNTADLAGTLLEGYQAIQFFFTTLDNPQTTQDDISFGNSLFTATLPSGTGDDIGGDPTHTVYYEVGSVGLAWPNVGTDTALETLTFTPVNADSPLPQGAFPGVLAVVLGSYLVNSNLDSNTAFQIGPAGAADARATCAYMDISGEVTN